MCERKQFYSVTAVKLNTQNIPKTKAAIESAWNQYFPEYAFTSSYLDENIAKFYQQEDQLALLYKIFAGIAIFISCLGLYGLVSFMAIQKTREIGVRKVLGASVKNIIYLFSKEFTLLISYRFYNSRPDCLLYDESLAAKFCFPDKNECRNIYNIAVLISIIIAWIAVGINLLRPRWPIR